MLACTARHRRLSCRLMSSELKLCHYSLEACVAAVMRRRVPHVSQAVMATWFNAGHAGGEVGAFWLLIGVFWGFCV